MKTDTEHIFEFCTQLMKIVNKYLVNLSDDQRYDLFCEFADGYCRDCGAKKPCYCCRDD